MSFDYDDCEVPEFYDERRVTARKRHRCVECSREISAGSVYVRCCIKFDGHFSEEKQHVECRDFAAKVNLDHLGGCVIPFGAIPDAMRNPDDYGLDGDDDLPALQAEWARIKTLYPEFTKEHP